MNKHFLSKIKAFSFLTISLITFTQTIYTSEGKNDFPVSPDRKCKLTADGFMDESFSQHLLLTPGKVQHEKYLMAPNDKLPSKNQLSQKLQQKGLSDFNKKTKLIDSVLGSPKNSRQIVRIIDSAVEQYTKTDAKRLYVIRRALFLAIFDTKTLQYLLDDGCIDLVN